VIDDLIDELDETLTWIQGSDYEHCLVRHIERAASLFTVLFCLEYEPDDAALRRVAELERLDGRANIFFERCVNGGCPPDIKVGVTCRYADCHPCWLAWARRESARITRRKAAARLARRGKP